AFLFSVMMVVFAGTVRAETISVETLQRLKALCVSLALDSTPANLPVVTDSVDRQTQDVFNVLVTVFATDNRDYASINSLVESRRSHLPDQIAIIVQDQSRSIHGDPAFAEFDSNLKVLEESLQIISSNGRGIGNLWGLLRSRNAVDEAIKKVEEARSALEFVR